MHKFTSFGLPRLGTRQKLMQNHGNALRESHLKVCIMSILTVVAAGCRQDEASVVQRVLVLHSRRTSLRSCLRRKPDNLYEKLARSTDNREHIGR
ncbi:hypothetical protein BS17DRAFT_351170 [Gyrodon lividus]|nr:hypothetical protein BS17DRAFT_351170 [Gyrodon lividus]